MMAAKVPGRSSRCAGTGTVAVVPFSRFCITMWLPLLLTSTKPCLESSRQTPAPDQARNLANRRRYFHLRHIHFAAESFLDFLLFRHLEE